MKGTIIDNVLVKRGKQVIKYWKYNGYAVREIDLDKVRGVKLYTEYDRVIYADRHVFYKHGIRNVYNGEEQLVLPVKYWEQLEVIK